jgi:hypothetical protein
MIGYVSAPVVLVLIRDATNGDDLGHAWLPPPVEAGDLVMLRLGPPLRIVRVLAAPVSSGCAALIECELVPPTFGVDPDLVAAIDRFAGDA